MSTGPHVVAEAGAENLARLKSKLRRHPAAMARLMKLGLNGATIDRLHLGLKEPYRSRTDALEVRDALCFPVLDSAMRPLGRYAYMNLHGVTVNPSRDDTWGPGAAHVYQLGSKSSAVAVVTAGIVDCWLAWQMSGSDCIRFRFISRSHAGAYPEEWRSPDYWGAFERIIVLPGVGADELIGEIAQRVSAPIFRFLPPAPASDLRDLTASRIETSAFVSLLDNAKPWLPDLPTPIEVVPHATLGSFQADPITISGAYVAGHSYYPFAVERRAYERGTGTSNCGLVQSYSTVVLRSDGSMLSVERLPAPRGTPADQRILALSDGTRIIAEPKVSLTSTWSFSSIQRFIDWRREGGPAPFRPLAAVLRDIEFSLRSRVWLPIDDQYLLGALYVVLSHTFQVFDAIPLLLLMGPRGTGKSELGEAIAGLSCNATVVGQLRAAGMVRLLDETRGLLVLDDMDGMGSAAVAGTGEFAQTLKTSYKRSTSLKPVADRGGRVRIMDFYGPKVISNTIGVDDVLGSRMLAIETAKRPDTSFEPSDAFEGGELALLRDELHCWSMANGSDIRNAYDAVPDGRRNRRSEISAPMLALATLTGDHEIRARLARLLADPRTHPSSR